jgi:hypothetical protein
MAVKNCYDCTYSGKKVTVEAENGKKHYFSICSKEKLVDYLQADKCKYFEHKQGNKEEACYLFTEEEWEAICNGTYVP